MFAIFSLRVFLYFVFLYPKQTNQNPLLFHKVPFPNSWCSSPDSHTRFTFSFLLFSTSTICNMRHCKTSFLIYFLSLNEHKQFNYNQQHYMNKYNYPHFHSPLLYKLPICTLNAFCGKGATLCFASCFYHVVFPFPLSNYLTAYIWLD